MSFLLNSGARFRSERQVLKPRLPQLSRLNALVYRDPETEPQCLDVNCHSFSNSEPLSDSHSDPEDDNIFQPQSSESYVGQVVNERENSGENVKADDDSLKDEFNSIRANDSFQTKSVSSKTQFISVKAEVNSLKAEDSDPSNSGKMGSSEETELNSTETEELISKETAKTAEISPPVDFLCPLSLDIMVDPVTIISGQTYERAFLEKWLEGGHRTCPSTNIVLEDTKMFPNRILKVMILEWCEKHNYKLPEIEAVNERVEEIVKSGKGGGGEGEGRSEGEESMDFHHLGMGALRRRQVRSTRLKHFRQMMANMKPNPEKVENNESLERNLGKCKRLEELVDFYGEVEDREKGKKVGEKEVGYGGGEECSISKACSGCCKKNSKRRGEKREGEGEEEKNTFLGENEKDEENKRKTVIVLRRLTKISSVVREIVATLDAVPFLLEIISKSEGCIMDDALTAILNLSVEHIAKQIVVSSGGIPILVKIVKDENSNNKCVGLAVGILCQLTVVEENRFPICKTGVICQFLDILCKEDVSLRLQRDATLALFNLGIDEFCREEIVVSGGVDRILCILAKNIKSQLREDVVLLLSVISKSKTAQGKLVEKGGVATVWEIFKKEPISSPLSGHIIAILFQIASGSPQGKSIVLEKISLSKICSMAKGGRSQGETKALALLQVLKET